MTRDYIGTNHRSILSLIRAPSQFTYYDFMQALAGKNMFLASA